MKEYVIIAGTVDRPTEVMRGVLEKGAEKGLGGVIYTESGKTMNRRGDIGFPNRAELWGRRIIRDAKGKIVEAGRQIDVKNPAYQGEVEFLEWNDRDGTLIVCRYLKGYNTLDLIYQNIVLNAEEGLRDDTEASADANWIRLATGDNVIDEDSDPLFAQYLKAHDFNESSVSKSPNSNYHLYRDKKFDSPKASQTKDLNSKFEALKIVNESAKDSTFGKLRTLATITGGLLGDTSKDESLYPELQKAADENPAEFLDYVAGYKRDVSNAFEKAKAAGILGLKEDGSVTIKEGNKHKVIAEGCPAKGEAILTWCLEDFTNDKAFEIVYQICNVIDTLK